MTTLTTLREGPGWAVINKPAGIATERHFQYDTVEARAQVQWQRPGAKKPAYVGIVHRLDRVTSGALVLARNKSTLVKLNAAFAEGRAAKRYWAITAKPLPERSGELLHHLGRRPDNKLAFTSTRPVPDTKEARLRYRLLEERDGLYQYEIELLTGRFHQIRAQFAAVGAPIVGDHAYGSLRPLREHCIALHARLLAFPDPGEGEGMVEVEAALPDYWLV